MKVTIYNDHKIVVKKRDTDALEYIPIYCCNDTDIRFQNAH
jgi:hypothetical protein